MAVFDMNRDVLKGFVDPVILSLLSRGDSYGYEMARSIDEDTGGALQFKEGTLYPALRRLEAEEYIEGYWGVEEKGARRRYYRLTKRGADALERAKHEWSRDKRTLNRYLGEAFVL